MSPELEQFKPIFVAIEVALFGTVFALGTICGISRTVRDGSFRSIYHLGAIGVSSGGISFGVIALLCAAHFDRNHYFWPLVGMAALLGHFGKELEAPISKLLFLLLKKIFDKVSFIELDTKHENP